MRLISRRAPTSTPRVGSIMIRMRASAASQRAICTFCWLPPDSVCTSASIDAALMLQRVDLVDGAPPARRRRRATPWRTILVEAGDADIVGDRLLADQAVAAILRHQPEPERHGVVGAADRRLRLPSTRIVPSRRAGPGAVDRQRGLDAAGAEQARTGRRPRPCGRRGRGRLTRILPSGSKTPRPRTSSATSPSALARRRSAVSAVSPIISATISLARHVGRRVAPADAAVAHDDDAVGDGEDLGQAVRDEDDRDAARLQRAHPVEQPQRLRSRSAPRSARRGSAAAPSWPARGRSRRAAGVARSSDDIGASGSTSRPKSASAALARRSRSATSIMPQRVGSSLRVMFSATVRSGTTLTSCGTSATPAASAVGDARRARTAGRRRLIVAVVAAGGVRAGEDLDQRRLAGAVLAEQRHDLAGRDREARRRRARARRGSAWSGRVASRIGVARRSAGVADRRPCSRRLVAMPIRRPAHWQAGFLSGTFL